MTSRTRRGLAAAAGVLVVLGLVVAARCSTRASSSSVAPRSAAAAPARDHAERRAAIARARRGLTPALPRVELRGRVVDGDDRPVAGAAVVLGAADAIVRSAADGTFAFTDLVPGVYGVEARARDRIGGPRRVVLSASTEPIVLRLYRGAIAEVEVVSAVDGRPIAGAEVSLRELAMVPDAGRQRALTGDDGVARFEALTVMAHEVFVHAPGFAPTTDTLDPTTVARGRWRMRVALEAGATLTGTVVDPAGRPVPGATIEIHAAGDGDSPRGSDVARYGAAHPVLSQTTGAGVPSDAEGRFQLALAAGRWQLTASHPAYQTTASMPLVSDGRTPGTVTITLETGRRVAGVVVDRDDRPVAGADVEARWSFGGRVERRGKTDGTGRFELVGLPPGRIDVLAIGATATSAPAPLDLSDGDPEELVLVLDNDARIDGVVQDDRGRPVRDAEIAYVEITARRSPLRVYPAVVTADDQGRFAIAGLSGQRVYGLTARRPQDGDHHLRTGGATARAGETVTLVIPGDGAVIGRVLRDGKRPPRGTTVELRGVTAPVEPDAAGRFRFDGIPPGVRTVLVHGRDVPEITVEEVKVEAGHATDVGTIDLPRGRLVAGHVRRGDGRPAVGVDVTVAPDAGRAARAITDDAGAFSVLVAEGQPLRVRARHRAGRVSDELRVAAAGDAEHLALVLADGTMIEGDARTGDAPIVDAYVFVHAPGGSPDDPVTYAQTDDAGYFRIRGVPPGVYVVELRVVDPDTFQATRYLRDVTVADGPGAFLSFDTSTEQGAPP